MPPARPQGAALELGPATRTHPQRDPPLDLAERPAFLRANEEAVRELAGCRRGITAVVGHLARATSRTGRSVANSASVLRDGQVLHRRDKMLLPNYDVFDEMRYFQPADANAPFDLDGTPVGLTICEDAWNDEGSGRSGSTTATPSPSWSRAGARLVINSPPRPTPPVGRTCAAACRRPGPPPRRARGIPEPGRQQR